MQLDDITSELSNLLSIMEYQIFWSHLTPEAQEAFKDLWHENIEMNPLAIIDKEFTYEEKLKIANDWLDKEVGVGWDDLPDINSLHEADSIEEIHDMCQDRLNE